jgi:hypothetical protein
MSKSNVFLTRLPGLPGLPGLLSFKSFFSQSAGFCQSRQTFVQLAQVLIQQPTELILIREV